MSRSCNLLPETLPIRLAAMKLLLLLALLAFPVALFADGGLPNQPYIYVEGKAEIEKPADMVTLRFDVVARNADQAKANAEVQGKAGKILGMANDRKIAQTDVIATDLKSQPQYEGEEEDSSRKRGNVIGYIVTRSFLIKMRDITLFAKLVDELLAIPGVQFSGIEAGLADEMQMEDEVWEKALKNARGRADKTLKNAGMKVDGVFALSPVAFPSIQQQIFGAGNHPAFAEEVGRAPDLSQYRLAPITVRQSVHVIYLISAVK